MRKKNIAIAVVVGLVVIYAAWRLVKKGTKKYGDMLSLLHSKSRETVLGEK
jgi:hypothetical protein